MAPITSRNLEIIIGKVHIKDGEWPGTDEHCYYDIESMSFEIVSTVGLPPFEGLFQEVYHKSFGCGDECLTVLNVKAKLEENGDIKVKVNTKFYEGTSEDPDELEAEKTEVLTIPMVGDISVTHHLIHEDIPDDETTVTLKFRNSYTESQWSPVISSGDIVAIHAALVPTENGDGEIILFGGDNHHHASALAHEFDHSARFNCRHPEQALIPVISPAFDVFCCGHAFLGDGRLMLAGGTEKFPQEAGGAHVGIHFEGHRHSAAYHPASGMFSNLPDMGPEPGNGVLGGGRWYPTLCTLENGDVYVFGGHPLGTDRRHSNHTPERYKPETNSWVILPAIGNPEGTIQYSRLHLVNDGRVFVTSRIDGYDKNILIDPATSAVQEVCPLPKVSYHGYARPSVLLPLVPEDNYQARFLLCGEPTSQFLDLKNASAGWQNVPRDGLSRPNRRNSNTTLLPTGDILLTGGTWDTGELEDLLGENNPEIYYTPLNRSTLTYTGEVGHWKTIKDAAKVTRNYHSTALLMPDGRVWTAGGNFVNFPGFGQPVKPPNENQKKIEIYNPPYPAGTRSTITSARSTVDYGDDIIIRSPQANIIDSVVLMRCGSSTHAFNSDQRAVYLRFRAIDGDQLIATAPPNGKIAPPGPYMLFIVDEAGRPCEYAHFVSLGGPNLFRISKSLDRARRHLDFSRNAAHIGNYAEAVLEAQAAVDELPGLEPPIDKKLNYLGLFSEASHTLVQRLFAAGRVGEAVEPAEETVQLYRQLATVSGANVAQTAALLLRLSSDVATVFLLTEAVQPAQAAVEILRGFEPTPNAQAEYLKLFAEALYTLAFRLQTAGHIGEAIQPAEEAVQVYRGLAEVDPVHFGPLLQKAEQLVASLKQS